MRVIPLPLLAALFASAPCAPAVLAQVAEPGPAPPIIDCRSAAQVFEQAAKLPPGLLLAIGQVESGRSDPMTGRAEPWPWATNHAGEGHYFASAQEAIVWVAAQLASGNRSIDVGCFQVNLFYHPDAFASLAEAFDPAANARYAAALLNRLHEQAGNWPSAIALYHSAEPFEGQRYSSRVIEAWNTGGRIVRIPVTAGLRAGDPVVVRLSPAAAAVRVVVPNWVMVRPAALLSDHPAGLPRVITPSR
ncbi:MAG TPA: transglycosylase SLT domain-containing protein [Acetobacteraceae bacterium]|nr:transglycosylase SLT domain-containing protein [Acetobacteraceae bacterium]